MPNVSKPGKSGTGIDFDAVDDVVTLPYGVANHDEITIATWVNWDGGGQWQRIFDFGNGTADNFFLTPRSGGVNTLRFLPLHAPLRVRQGSLQS